MGLGGRIVRKTAGFERAKRLAGSLPGVEEGTAYGSPALKVNGKMFTVIPIHPSAEPNSLAVRVDFPDRDELLAADPDIYYVKEHYANYSVILVRLSRIRDDALKDLLLMSWQFMKRSPKVTRPRRARAIHARGGR